MWLQLQSTSDSNNIRTVLLKVTCDESQTHAQAQGDEERANVEHSKSDGPERCITSFKGNPNEFEHVLMYSPIHLK